ncbi:ribosome recycling factor [Candidatus Bipolaricaulota bacterium]|nr:ribosome recycling factor [Candidatus Bipolaricaulota bacterium]MBS3792064.1 ribosome recycling factor [Candidatus Bipolaricaulota bacterium]
MKKKMENAVETLKEEMARIHVGQANPAMIEDLKVEYYGTDTPLNQISNISAPESGLLVVQPYDSSQIDAIEKAILESDLGLNPNNDGEIIRIPIPKLSGDRREELVEVIQEKGEETKITLRNIRRETNKEIEELEDEGDITEDDKYMLEDEVDEVTSSLTEKVDEIVENKSSKVRAV